MFKLLTLALTLLSIVVAQDMGDGVSKSTWGASDPTKCAKWLSKYMPVKVSSDSCPNQKCDCATQGRFQLEDGTNYGGFGIHTNNCTYHPYGEFSLMDIEAKIQKEWGNFSTYHPFMDYNVGFWANHLYHYIENFQKDSVPFTALKWKSDDDKEYYSIIANPCGYVVIEFIGDYVPANSTSIFKESDQLRFSFNSRNYKPRTETGHYLTPLKISRATNRLDDIKKYYDKDIGCSQLLNKTHDDGSELAIFMFDTPHRGVQLHFIQGAKPAIERNSGDNETFTPKDWEDYMHSVHKDVIKSPICGFDQWMDNHFAFDTQSLTSDIVVEKCEKMGLPYRWLQAGPQAGVGPIQVYAVDPTGFAVQFDSRPKGAPKTVPSYGANCSSNDGCSGQGLCKAHDVFFLQQ